MLLLRTLLVTLLVFASFVSAHAELAFYATGNNLSGPSTLYKVNTDGTHAKWDIIWDQPVEIYDPQGITVDRQGNVYVRDYDSIFKITPDGHGTIFASFSDPFHDSGIAVDSAGNVFATGPGPNFTASVYKYLADGTLQNTFSSWPALGALVLGPDGALYSGDFSRDVIYRIDPLTGASTDYASLTSAINIAFGPDGTLYATADDGVYKIVDGTASLLLASGGRNNLLKRAMSLWIDEDHTVYIGNLQISNGTSQILKLEAGATVPTVFATFPAYIGVNGMAAPIPEASIFWLVTATAGTLILIRRSTWLSNVLLKRASRP